ESEPFSAVRTNHINKRFSRSVPQSDPATVGDRPKNKYTLPFNHRMFDSATGPKGVISDARSYRAARASRKLTKRGNSMFLAFSGDDLASSPDTKADIPRDMLAAMRNLTSGRGSRIHEKCSAKDTHTGHGLGNQEEEESEDDEFGLVSQWREQRRAELQGKTFVKRTQPTVTAYGKL